jgi:branched-subunit amino acid aminotransferase/4-amino-4-deoxychorismate lyase
MLDLNGFVAETNATNIFFVRRGTVVTPNADACLPGITRGIVIELCNDAGLPLEERNVSTSEAYTADEVFTSGTMGELAPVLEIDGRMIGDGSVGPITRKLQDLFRERARSEGEPLR